MHIFLPTIFSPFGVHTPILEGYLVNSYYTVDLWIIVLNIHFFIYYIIMYWSENHTANAL